MNILRSTEIYETIEQTNPMDFCEIMDLGVNLIADVSKKRIDLEVLKEFREELKQKDFNTLDDLYRYLISSPHFRTDGEKFEPKFFMILYNELFYGDLEEWRFKKFDDAFFEDFKFRMNYIDKDIESRHGMICEMEKEICFLNALIQYGKDRDIQKCTERLLELEEQSQNISEQLIMHLSSLCGV